MTVWDIASMLLSYFNMQKEENPALGVRAIRICLNRPEVFRTQLRALYRASVYGKIAIMFPMITSVWEVKECKRACQSVMKELAAEGIPYNPDTELGTVMSTLATDNTFLILLNVAAAGHFFLDGFKGFFRNDCIMMVLNLKPLSLPLINDALLLWVRAALDLTIQDQIQARPDGRAYKA